MNLKQILTIAAILTASHLVRAQTPWSVDDPQNPTYIYYNNGGVAIGHDAPANPAINNEYLSVKGTIRALELRLQPATWSDYVFDENYRLPSLHELEQIINEQKHLPDIPPEKEVAENGVGLAEMQAKLLAKVEELTLYMIELDKEGEVLQERLRNLEQAEDGK